MQQEHHPNTSTTYIVNLEVNLICEIHSRMQDTYLAKIESSQATGKYVSFLQRQLGQRYPGVVKHAIRQSEICKSFEDSGIPHSERQTES